MTGALAIILARGGSKGLPRKNALPIAGKPCIAWTLDAALAARTVGTAALSTDDAELKSIARSISRDIRIIDRPADLASDSATIDSAARHAVTALSTSDIRYPTSDIPIVILYANVPIRPPGLIDRAVGMLIKTGSDSVQSYAPVGKNHPWWTARVNPETGEVRPWEGEVLNHGVFRRQDLPPAFIPDGGVIALTRAALFCELGVPPGPHAFFGRPPLRRGIISPEGSVIDIDNRIDLLVADAMLTECRHANR